MTTTYLRDPATGQILFDASGYPEIDTSVPNPNNYSLLQYRVGYETLGAVTNDDVSFAINDAIQEYERQDFWFNSMRYFGVSGSSSNLATVAGKEFYAQQDLGNLPAWPHISKIMVVAFGNRYPLNERTPQHIDDMSISTTWQGLPTDWCFMAGAIRIYPIPNGSYPLILDGNIRFRPLSEPTDFNCWTDEARNLIRYGARRRLMTDVNRDQAQAEIAAMGEQNELRALKRETFGRTGGPGKLRPSRGYF
jgi:hypothetical protein